MPVSIRCLVYNGPDAPIERGTLTLEEAEWGLLQRFAKYENELSRAVFVQAGLPHSTSFSYSQAGGWSPGDLPDDAQVREFLHLMRPFILESEDTYYHKVTGLLGRRLDLKKIRARLGSWKEWFTGRMSQSFMTFTAGDLVVNSQEALSLWLNAFEFHRNQDKAERFGRAFDTVPLEVLKGFFLDLLVSQAEAVQGVAAIIRDLQDARDRGQGWIA
jgi:hypothetical protein